MTTAPVIVTGDSTTLFVELKKNGASFVIDENAEVKVTFVSSAHQALLSDDPVAQISTSPGADWSNSLVAVVIPGTFTEPIDIQGNAYMEIQVNEDGTQTTWFVLVKIIKGNIS